MPQIEIRCPEDSRRLFTKLQLHSEQVHVTDDNLMEFSCDNCRKELRKQGKYVSHVLHRYNFLGDWVETVFEE